MADDRTQFNIDILARMAGGDDAIASLVTLGDTMLAGKATVADFERTIASMSSTLEQSGASMKVTADALTAGERAYSQAEIAAERAAKAVEKLNASGRTGDAFVKKQAEAAAKAEAAAAALKVEAIALDALKVKAGAAAASHDALSKGLKNVEAGAKAAAKAEAASKGSGKVNEIAEALGKLGGPAGVAGQKVFGLATGFQKLGASIGSAGPYVAAAVAIVAIGTAAIFAAGAIAHWGVENADAARTSGLLAAGIARSVEGGRELEATFDKLGGTVPQTRDELAAMAGDLAKTGLRGKDLSNALETAAIKAAKLKFGPEFGKQMLALPVQAQRLQSNLAKTFGGLGIEKLLDGVSKLVGLFDSSTESGKALKFLFEAIFQPIVDGVADAGPAVERFFLHAEILALKAYIALRPYSEQIALVGNLFLGGAAVIAGTFVAALAVLAVAVGAAVVAVGALLLGIYKLVTAPGEVFEAVKTGFGAAVTFMTELGANMIAGLVKGITDSASSVVKAIGGVVDGAIKSAKHLLGISSPSKVFAGIGDFTAQGFAEGVEGSDRPQSALSSMVAPPGASSGSTGSSARSISFGDIIVSGANAKEMAQDFMAQVTALLEQDAGMLGAGQVPA